MKKCIKILVICIGLIGQWINASAPAISSSNLSSTSMQEELEKLESKRNKYLKKGNKGKIQSVEAKIRDLKVKIGIEQCQKSKLPNVIQKIANSISLGSSQPTKENFIEIMNKYRIRPEFFYVIDLRGEPHIFINGKPHYLEPLRFDNADALIKYEQELVKNINEGKPVVAKELHKKKIGKQKILEYIPVEIAAEAHAQTEKDIAAQLGINYIRIPNDDHDCPNVESAYNFIKAINPFYKDLRATFLLHCHGGQGRTTFYSIVLDMLSNAKKDSLNDIIERQAKTFCAGLLGAKEKAVNKRKLLEVLYNYIRENKDNFKTPPQGDSVMSCEWIQD